MNDNGVVQMLHTPCFESQMSNADLGTTPLISLMKGLLTNLPRLRRGGHYLYCPDQKMHVPSVSKGNTLSIFSGSLLYKHPWKNGMKQRCQCFLF